MLDAKKSGIQLFGSNLTVAGWVRIVTFALSICALLAVTPAGVLFARLVKQLDDNSETTTQITDKLHEISKVQAVTAIILDNATHRIDGLEMRERNR